MNRDRDHITSWRYGHARSEPPYGVVPFSGDNCVLRLLTGQKEHLSLGRITTTLRPLPVGVRVAREPQIRSYATSIRVRRRIVSATNSTTTIPAAESAWGRLRVAASPANWMSSNPWIVASV